MTGGEGGGGGNGAPSKMGQGASLPETGVAAAGGGGNRGLKLKGNQRETEPAQRGISGGGDAGGDGGEVDGEVDGARALAEFQRLVTVAVQKGMMGMSDARVSHELHPAIGLESVLARTTRACPSCCGVCYWSSAVLCLVFGHDGTIDFAFI